MDTEDFDPLDVLSYLTDKIEEDVRLKSGHPAEQDAALDEYLRLWEEDGDISEPLKKISVDFEKDLDWFNVTQPVSLANLRGKLVVLDFFTYCCINCMHILPDLHALEEKFPQEKGLVVIGVHTPKFENEKDAGNLLAATQRYGIVHPIVNDPRRTLWNKIGIRCWPTLLVLSPSGVPLLMLMGEGHANFLEKFTERALHYFEKKSALANFTLELRPSTDMLPASVLRFPAKIARSDDGRFAVADAGNNRILVFNTKGTVLHQIGDGAVGFVDGDFQLARFNSPQGVTFLNADVLIVADTENHAVRQITLSTSSVETLVGTGKQGTDRVGGQQEAPLQPISSPWDVAVLKSADMDLSFYNDGQVVPEKASVLIAMAGTHQIWGYFPEGMIWWRLRQIEPRTCVALIGNGQEENRNNTYPQNAGFAQPSGLCVGKNVLYIADSESSSIRKACMKDGKVSAVVGGDRNPLNLFAFGDIDGKSYDAKLQHPLGVAYDDINDKLFVADTYNHKIKVIDPATSTITSLQIRTELGAPYQFNEPAGLCCDGSGEYLLVADTNNHIIQLVNLNSLVTRPLQLKFSPRPTETDASSTGLQLVKHTPLRSCRELLVHVAISLDDHLTQTEQQIEHSKWSIDCTKSGLRTSISSGRIRSSNDFDIQLDRSSDTVADAAEELRVDITLFMCEADRCLVKRFSLILRDVEEVVQSRPVFNESILVHVTPKKIVLKE